METRKGIQETNKQKNNPLRVYCNDQNDGYFLHWHTDMEIIVVLENDYGIIIDGARKTLHEGEIIIVPSGVLHELFVVGEGKRIILVFDYAPLFHMPGFGQLFYNLRPFVLLNKENMGSIQEKLFQIIHEIVDEYHHPAAYYMPQCYAKLTEFFVLYSRNQHEAHQRAMTDKKSNSFHTERLAIVCNFINEHCTEDISVEQLAAIAGYSTYHFARLFKKQMNITFYHYMTQRRIMYAETLLINPQITIMQAALQSGFESLSTFNRVFKKYKNCTPSEFIALLNSNHEFIYIDGEKEFKHKVRT